MNMIKPIIDEVISRYSNEICWKFLKISYYALFSCHRKLSSGVHKYIQYFHDITYSLIYIKECYKRGKPIISDVTIGYSRNLIKIPSAISSPVLSFYVGSLPVGFTSILNTPMTALIVLNTSESTVHIIETVICVI